MSSALVYTTKCNLCGFSITMPGLPDEDVDPRSVPPNVIQFNMKLLEHLNKGAAAEQKSLDKAQAWFKKNGGPPPDASQAVHLLHLRAYQEIMARVALAQGSATMHPYSSQDPVFQKLKDVARLRLNTVTRKYYFDDAMLLNAVVQLDLHPAQHEMVLKLVTAIRDALMEQGDYAPDKDKALVALV